MGDDQSVTVQNLEQLRREAELTLSRDAADDHDVVLALGNRLIQEDPSLAARLFADAAQSAYTSRRWERAAVAGECAVRAWLALGRTDEAMTAAAGVRQAADRISDVDIRLRVLSNLAPSLREFGLADQAADILTWVVAQRRAQVAATSEADVVEALTVALVNLATVLTDQGHAADGLELLQEAQKLAEDRNDLKRLGTIKINMAFAYSAIGQLRLARMAYRAAADLYRRSDADNRDVGYALRGEAATLARTGRFAEAVQVYAEAIRLFGEAKATIEVLRVSIGHLMARASLGERISHGEIDQAEQDLDRLPLNEQGQLARNLANICFRQGDPERAERLYLRARDAYARLDRPAEIASIDMSRAVAARQAGDPARARDLLLAARPVMADHHRWQQVGHIDHNLALVLTDLANADATAGPDLVAEAASRSISAVAALDRFRHDLPTAHDRLTLERSVYPGLFVTAILNALAARRPAAVAALVERARIQPVLPDVDGGMAFLEPRPLAARPGDEAVGGRGESVHLSIEATRLAGPGAQWVGWWSDGKIMVAAATDASGVDVDAQALDDCLTRLAAALPIPTPAEHDLVDGDEALASALSLWRAARGPLLRDPILENQVAVTIPERLLRAARADHMIESLQDIDDADLLWPVSQMLFGEAFLGELAAAPTPQPLVLAPPPILGRVPWAALPVNDPRTGPVRRLIEVADLVIGLPASLSASLAERDPDPGPVLLVADPRGDLPHARRLRVPDVLRLGTGHAPATRDAFVEAASRAGMLVLVAHVRPGEPADPAASAIRLHCDDVAGESVVTAADLAKLRVPGVCVVLGCDGAGVATGNEWTGIATGLVWAGATQVITTTWPVIDDMVTTAADEALIEHVRRHDPYLGLWSWQRAQAAALRTHPRSRVSAVYRWAGTVAIGTPGGARHR